MKRVKVLIIEDSPLAQTVYSQVLGQDPMLEVLGATGDIYQARELVVQREPDVLVLDLEMAQSTGMRFLEAVMKHMPVRTVGLCLEESTAIATKALALGAMDVLKLPSADATDLKVVRVELAKRVRTAALMSMNRGANAAPGLRSANQIFAIASSTGGTEALKKVLPLLPAEIPPILIVQHMPAMFTASYASALQSLCKFEVREAKDGDPVVPGRALIAPGDFHMEIVKKGAFYFVRLHQEPQLHGVRPAADFLMRSVAKYVGANSVGVVLTGMGKDGAQGLLAMRKAGAHTIAQNEKTCVVYGMPKEAFEAGAVKKVLPLELIADEMVRHFKVKTAA